MTTREALETLCRENGILAVYLFGSRADDGLRLLAGEAVGAEGSDLDIGLVFRDPRLEPRVLWGLQVAFEDLFVPLAVDLVPLQRVDPIFQLGAIDGHRVAATDSTAADRYELAVMNQAEELLPIQREIERQRFGRSTT
jgi:predicted nucleotidyltransferase